MTETEATAGLSGLVVIEITDTLGAAFAVSLLADAGATAIMCENPEGSALRRLGGGPLDLPRWRILARNKQSIVVDPNDPAAPRILGALLRRADLLVTDTAPPARAQAVWFAAFAALAPTERPILVEVFPTGVDRPDLWRWDTRPEFAAAASGLMALTGYEGGKPMQPEVPIADYLSGTLACARALMALRERQGGNAAEIAVPLHAALQRMIEWQVPVATALGRAERRVGNNFPMNAGVANMHRTREGKYIALSAVTQATALRLMTMIGGPPLAADPRFATTAARVQSLDALYAVIDGWMATRTVPEILAEAAAHDVVLGPVYDTADLLADAQIAFRGNILTVAIDDGPLAMPAPVPQGKGATPIRAPGPAIGADTGAILRWLECDEVRAPRRAANPRRLRVIELGTVIAGPFAGSLMADFGAEVIKIETPGTPDGLRQMGPKAAGTPLWFGVAVRGKSCTTLNLKSEAGKALFRRLIATADVLIENYRPGVLERLGLGWESLRQINPALVVLSISGFGQTGPQSGRPGFGKIAEGLSGVVGLTGDPGDRPLFVGLSLADAAAGLFGVQAIAAALYRRDAMDAMGTRIDIALYEPLLRMLDAQFAAAALIGSPPTRRGSGDPYGFGVDSPDRPRFHVVAAKDGSWYIVAIDTPGIADRLDRRIADDLACAPAQAVGRLDAWCRSYAPEALEAALRALGAALAPVHDGLSIAASPYFRARGDVTAAELPGLGTIGVPGSIDAANAPTGRLDAPAPGADNRTVLCGLLGQSDDVIVRLTAEGVI